MAEDIDISIEGQATYDFGALLDDAPPSARSRLEEASARLSALGVRASEVTAALRDFQGRMGAASAHAATGMSQAISGALSAAQAQRRMETIMGIVNAAPREPQGTHVTPTIALALTYNGVTSREYTVGDIPALIGANLAHADNIGRVEEFTTTFERDGRILDIRIESEHGSPDTIGHIVRRAIELFNGTIRKTSYTALNRREVRNQMGMVAGVATYGVALEYEIHIPQEYEHLRVFSMSNPEVRRGPAPVRVPLPPPPPKRTLKDNPPPRAKRAIE